MRLVEALVRTGHPDWAQRREAAEALGGFPDDDRAHGALVAMLDDADSAVIIEAARVLVRHGGARGLRAALVSLAADDPDTVDDLAGAIGSAVLRMNGPVADRLQPHAEADPTLADAVADLLRDLPPEGWPELPHDDGGSSLEPLPHHGDDKS